MQLIDFWPNVVVSCKRYFKSVWVNETFVGIIVFSHLCRKSDSRSSSAFSVDVDSFVASKAERRFSTLGWPSADRPVAFDIVFDFVIRDLDGAAAPEKQKRMSRESLLRRKIQNS
jgi:hypothetical protein